MFQIKKNKTYVATSNSIYHIAIYLYQIKYYISHIFIIHIKHMMKDKSITTSYGKLCS